MKTHKIKAIADYDAIGVEVDGKVDDDFNAKEWKIILKGEQYDFIPGGLSKVEGNGHGGGYMYYKDAALGVIIDGVKLLVVSEVDAVRVG